jgi:hypothetical protein
MATTDQIGWIRRINDPTNWTGYTSNANYNNGGPDYSGSCISFSFSSTGFQPGLWDGIESIDWHDCNNWNDLKVPVTETDVNIPPTTNDPHILTGRTGICRTVSIDADGGATLYLDGTGTLNITMP